MPAAYNQKVGARGDAARGILETPTYLTAAGGAGVNQDTLEEISQHEQTAKKADKEQNQLKSEAKGRNDKLKETVKTTRKMYTEFKERRKTRIKLFQAPEQSKLLSAMTTDYSRKTEVDRKDESGKPIKTLEESQAMVNRLSEIVSAVGAVLAEPDLVASFLLVNYGEPALKALFDKATGELAEGRAILELRHRAEDATKREHEAVAKVQELWTDYGPGLRRAARGTPGMGGLLKKT